MRRRKFTDGTIQFENDFDNAQEAEAWLKPALSQLKSLVCVEASIHLNINDGSWKAKLRCPVKYFYEIGSFWDLEEKEQTL